MNKTYDYNKLENANFTLNAIVDIISVGIWDWNRELGNVQRNTGWYEMFGYTTSTSEKDILIWENIIHPDDYARVMNNFELFLAKKIDIYEIEYRCKKSDGSYLWVMDKAKSVEEKEDGSIARIIGTLQDIHKEKMLRIDLLNNNLLLKDGNITLEKMLEEKNKELQTKNKELEKKIQRIEFLSNTDALTNLPNRRMFEVLITKACARAIRYGTKLSLVIIDIDHFKKINDTYGHKVGDVIISKLGQVFEDELRKNDFVARWGGEEFVILLSETNLENAIQVAEKIRKAIESFNFQDEISLTCSFGLTEYKPDESTDELFVRADTALYKAKRNGRNRVESNI